MQIYSLRSSAISPLTSDYSRSTRQKPRWQRRHRAIPNPYIPYHTRPRTFPPLHDCWLILDPPVSAVLVQFLRVRSRGITMVFKGFVIRELVLRVVGEAREGPYLFCERGSWYEKNLTGIGPCERNEDEIFSIDAVPFLYNYCFILNSDSFNS